MNQTALQHPLTSTVADGTDRQPPPRTYEWRQMVGFGMIGLGVVAVMIGWFGVSGEAEPWQQMPYLASGGIGGAAAIAVGITCLISFEHAADRRVLVDLLERLAIIEAGLDELRARPEATEERPDMDRGLVAGSPPRKAPRRTVRKS